MLPVHLSENTRCEVRHIGREGAPLFVVDDAFADPSGLVDQAKQAPFMQVRGAGNHFPGKRAALEPSYAATMHGLIKPYLDDVFGIAPSAPYEVSLCHFQLVCTEPAMLSLPQRLPHFDTFEQHQIALLHYLTHDDQGGTDFYRHRSTGYERITAERFKPYTQELVREVKAKGPPPLAYFCGATDQYELIETVRPVFNRVIAYFSNSLHSGHIRPDRSLSPSPDTGRLTATVFLRFRPARP